MNPFKYSQTDQIANVGIPTELPRPVPTLPVEEAFLTWADPRLTWGRNHQDQRTPAGAV